MMDRYALVAAAMVIATPVLAQNAPIPAERQQQLLLDAAKLGRADLIPAFKTQGTNLNVRDGRGFTPLILAAYNGHAETVDALLAAGADACLADTAQGNTALMGVAFKGHDAIAKRLLAAGCDVNARNGAGQTALMMAALFGRTAQVDMLLAAGADATLADASGRTAATVAKAQGNDALARTLER